MQAKRKGGNGNDTIGTMINIVSGRTVGRPPVLRQAVNVDRKNLTAVCPSPTYRRRKRGDQTDFHDRYREGHRVECAYKTCYGQRRSGRNMLMPQMHKLVSSAHRVSTLVFISPDGNSQGIPVARLHLFARNFCKEARNKGILGHSGPLSFAYWSCTIAWASGYQHVVRPDVSPGKVRSLRCAGNRSRDRETPRRK